MPLAVVTGATQGIGKAIAEKFLSHNFSVAICSRSKDDLDQVKNEWLKKYPGASVYTFLADMGDRKQVEDFAMQIRSIQSSIDAIVNNAGLFFPGNLSDEPEGHLASLMNVNLFGAYQLTRALLPYLKTQKRGHIFNICSIASLRAYDNGGAYSVTKYALLGFSENLRHELMKDDIKVTAILPGATWSRSWSQSGLPKERFIQAADIAALVWTCYTLSASANVDQIIVRPLKGDI